MPAQSGDQTVFQVQGFSISLRHLGSSVAFVTSLAVLSACVSTTGASKIKPETSAEEAAQGDGEGGNPQVAATAGASQDQQVVALGAGQQEAGYPAQAAMPVADTEPGPLVLQSTGLKATSSSIFANRPARALVPAQQMPEGQGVTPSSNSLFNAGQQQPMPVEGSEAKKVLLPGEGASRAAPHGNPNQATSAGPLPGTAAENEVAGVEHISQPAPAGSDKPADAAEALSLAGLFSAKRKGRQAASGLPQDQVAALGYTAWPSNRAISMFATVEDDDPSHDDESPAIEMAALPGLARLAPNGLWLQTEKVDTGCFQPELMGLLKNVEQHYGQKVIVTSGHRDVAHNASVGGAPRSRHISCEAADIQVPGVDKWELASYLRALPGRGGIGTYCHTQSVHIDTGKRRDWNWGCTRKV
ncbi:hypothetical protein ASE37_18785 [Rhizobium sp. Root268]|nr:hypothetical protein ASC86_18285 [Rhizobium sp. Root1212]KRD21572.1 hypothetical protein ASE37_18785 [Rhizobium sp. Root268]